MHQQRKLNHFIKKSVAKTGTIVGSQCKASRTLHYSTPFQPIQLASETSPEDFDSMQGGMPRKAGILQTSLTVKRDFPFRHSTWPEPGVWTHPAMWYGTVLFGVQCCISILCPLQLDTKKNHCIDYHPTGNIIYTQNGNRVSGRGTLQDLSSRYRPEKFS